jgi:hypothetical protein
MENLKESIEEKEEDTQKLVKQIVKKMSDLTLERNQMVIIEEQIKEFLIENAIRRTEREKLIELLPEMVRSGQSGRPTLEMVRILNSLDENKNKERLTVILQQYKLLVGK